MNTSNSEKHYMVGLIVAVLGLYSASIYNYYKPDANTVINVATAAEVADPIGTSEYANTLNTQQLGEGLIFRPINSSRTIYVPGSNCTITDANLAPAGFFRELPYGCSFTDVGSR